MQEKFNTKIDPAFTWLSWILSLVLILPALELAMKDTVFKGILQLTREPPPFVLAVFTLTLCFILQWMRLRTFYLVTERDLTIICGPFRWVIAIADIDGLKKSTNLAASPALSTQRLVVHFKDRILYISPEQEDTFIQCMVSRNPKIKIPQA